MLKKLIKLNLDDLWIYIGVEGGLFLLIEIVICCVMRFVKPEDSVTVGNVLFPIAAGFIALVAGISHVGLTFDQAIQFGQTRRRAMGLTLGVMFFETAFGMALGAVLSALEQFVCPHLWAWAAGMDGWVASDGMAAIPEYMAEEGGRWIMGANGLEQVAENTLIIRTFTLDWYWWLLAFVISMSGGLIVGALIQRFGQKGGWIIWGICVAPMLLVQIVPWKADEVFTWIWPMLGVLFAAGLVWSVWSMLHAVVKA